MGGIIAIPAAIVFGIAILNPKNFIYWCKWIVSYTYVEIEKRKLTKRFDLYDYSNRKDPRAVNFLIPKEEYELESPHPDSYLLKAEDEVFFYGTNSKSELLVVKISRGWNNRADACIYMKLANGKVYELVKTSDFQQSCTDDMTFSCGGLQLQCNNPMRSWRIFYSGYLREISGDNPSDSRMVYVKFALLWKAASDVHDFQQDIVKKSLAGGLSKVAWGSFHPHITETKKALDFYGQAGIMHGKITVENEIEDHEIYLFGQRIRYLGNASNLKDMEFCHTLGYVLKNGTYLHLGKVSSTNIIKNYHSGFVVLPDGSMKDIYNASISVSDLEEQEKFQSNFKTDLFNFTFNGSINNVVSSNENTKNSLRLIEFELNGEKGYGIQLQRKPAVRIESQYSEVYSVQAPSVVPPVVSFKEDICQLSEITGGKGSSLGKLTQLSKEIQAENSNQQCFTVPNGIVVTTSAYESFLTKNVLIEIKALEDNLYKDAIKPDDVKKACGRVSSAIIETEFPSTLEECICKSIEVNFGKKIYSGKFAVRSSATGEDTEQMSAAGQMETFLGVYGFDEILLAVKKCWASQFSFIAIEYKRRHGQNLNSPMAVVIQEMIHCDVAGVLFTCDPLTGNPTLMSITANYGLGESVVSGLEEPDIVQLKRDIEDEVSIIRINVGAKSHKITIKDGQGTHVSEVPENERNICSLSEENALYLANLAIKIEKYYRSHRDIEWGFYNDTLYIFQSRPVTSGTNEAVYEIEHEFDSPMRVENDFFSVSNVGEVFPGAISPLGMTVLIKGFGILQNSEERITDMQLQTRTDYFPMGWLMMSGHTIFNVVDIFHTGLNNKMSVLDKATIISFFGRMLDNEEMFQVAQARYGGLPQRNSLVKMCKLVKLMLTSGKKIRNTMKNFSTYRIPIERYNTAKEFCTAIVKTCWDITDVLLAHMLSTQISSVWNMVIFSTLGAAQGDFDDTVYRDFSMLVKTDIDVESADVPSAIQKLAFQISKSFDSTEFKKISTEEALEMLKTSNSEAGEQFRAFLKKHGHRCLQEFDIYSHSWREKPETLVKVLQNMCGSVMKDSAEKKQDDLNELISKVTVPLKRSDKLKLKFILPWSRKAVQRREMSKSMLVKVIDEWRRAYRRLAQLMVQEGRIPEEDLFYFMTIEEVTHFLENNSPKIIAKATQRKRRFPVMHKYRFPEIMKGFPRPIDDTKSSIIINDDDFSMKGIPVSQGVAKGFIRKALYLEEAEDIQPGEILLTYGTDIGWTPYFPQLAGVVTELGGLISHGAVVSREYGIPCIAGLHGATKNFQTGDYVLLDGNKGILMKIKEPDI